MIFLNYGYSTMYGVEREDSDSFHATLLGISFTTLTKPVFRGWGDARYGVSRVR
jgi:hypothetical protein